MISILLSMIFFTSAGIMETLANLSTQSCSFSSDPQLIDGKKNEILLSLAKSRQKDLSCAKKFLESVNPKASKTEFDKYAKDIETHLNKLNGSALEIYKLKLQRCRMSPMPMAKRLPTDTLSLADIEKRIQKHKLDINAILNETPFYEHDSIKNFVNKNYPALHLQVAEFVGGCPNSNDEFAKKNFDNAFKLDQERFRQGLAQALKQIRREVTKELPEIEEAVKTQNPKKLSRDIRENFFQGGSDMVAFAKIDSTNKKQYDDAICSLNATYSDGAKNRDSVISGVLLASAFVPAGAVRTAIAKGATKVIPAGIFTLAAARGIYSAKVGEVLSRVAAQGLLTAPLLDQIDKACGISGFNRTYGTGHTFEFNPTKEGVDESECNDSSYSPKSISQFNCVTTILENTSIAGVRSIVSKFKGRVKSKGSGAEPEGLPSNVNE